MTESSWIVGLSKELGLAHVHLEVSSHGSEWYVD